MKLLSLPIYATCVTQLPCHVYSLGTYHIRPTADVVSQNVGFVVMLSLGLCMGLLEIHVFLVFLSQELLTRHKMLAADFLEANFDKVFTHYQKLLHSDNYVTRRQSLKLLGELLLDRHNFSVSLIIIIGGHL